MPEQTIESPEQIFSNQGVPFKSEQAARAAMTREGVDSEKYHVRSHGEGYVIQKKPEKTEDKYYRVMFAHKSSPHDEDDVTLIVNGEVLVIQRGVETIIPGRFKECADHATYPQFTQKPNQARKVVGTVMVFPYSLMGEATEAEYRKMLREGTQKTREALAAANKLVE